MCYDNTKDSLIKEYKNMRFKHPENPDNFEWSKNKLIDSLKMRGIWQDSLEHENNLIKAMLQDCWFPYFKIIEAFLGNSKKGYELESGIFLTDEARVLPIFDTSKERKVQPLIEVAFYWVPLTVSNTFEEDLYKIEIGMIPWKITNKYQQAFILENIEKFQEEIGLPVIIVYE